MSLFNKLFDAYHQFHADEIQTNRFTPDLFHKVLDQYTGEFIVRVEGKSIEGRDIRSIRIGTGKTRILMWSQMHGDESTATRAILDILKFLNTPGEFEDLSQKLLKSVTLCIIPILNPDGAARFQRRNAINIDINRDARAFTSPEARVLQKVINDFKPGYAFNLHDQDRSYMISGLHKPGTISLLAPSFNDSDDMNQNKEEAMKLIALIRKNLESVIPNQVGLYNSEYTPRAFGEYAQRKGVSTVLVESGWFHNDPEKEFVRKLNFCLLTNAISSIVDQKHQRNRISEYNDIPYMDEHYFDLLVRNVNLKKGEKVYSIDIGIRHEEVNNGIEGRYYTVGKISEIGDLSECLGFTVLDEQGLFIEPGKVMNRTTSLNGAEVGKTIDLLQSGYLYLSNNEDYEKGNTESLINSVNPGYKPEPLPQINGLANFLLATDTGDVKYVVSNGYLWKTGTSVTEDHVGLRI